MFEMFRLCSVALSGLAGIMSNIKATNTFSQIVGKYIGSPAKI